MALGQVTGKFATYRFGYEDGRFSIFADTEKLKGHSLVSPRDPVREAERHIGTFRLKPGMLALVAGVGHLPMLEMLVEQLNTRDGQGGLIIAFEADTELYLALKKARPDIFADVAVIVPENATVIAELVERLDVENFIGYRAFENRGSVELNSSFYAQAIADFKQKLASRFSDLFTRLEFEERWVFNALSKLPLLSSARPVSALFGLGKGSEAILVSTGPSLRSTIENLKAVKDKYFIACADSAYRVLVRSGINPHLVFSLDSQAHTTKHFGLLPRGKPGNFPLLVCDAVSNPVVARDWRGEMAISFTAQYIDDRRVVSPGCDYLEEQRIFAGAGELIPGDLQSGGSVATSIFDLLRLMQFDRIIFLGQDLAYTNREIHTPGTHHTDEWLARTTNRLQPLENINERVLRRRHTKREVSLTGRPIVTDYILSLYRDWFVTAMQRIDNKVANATGDGLQIPGAERLSEIEASPAGDLQVLLKAYLNSALLSVDTEKLGEISKRIASARRHELPAESLSFMRYVGRKFSIKATRTPESRPALLTKQRTRQKNFLRKLATKLGANA
ncbi:motility associated factor glycosyltransferase family protein [Turneriella parva]|uniref:6-hydroxymethylpterin diphosphokinase MptE-like domain-containing protein n=1 Tax=Turneriella parva (strain ATCC BAA-1111 / DSM 21527 / NCTC 11395 / H) TaxID=869212 RepID=I4B2U8_TURPD|nr:6-hydroxymethylpterin diphosphokinase MptE-like protein [Turneriella parva]AFM11605.1 protein of unknown function DUF115 [Turneriella parva DSM 21527]